MSWYRFRRWYMSWNKRNTPPDLIYWYKEYVLKTPEQREAEKVERNKSYNKALFSLGTMLHVLNGGKRIY